MTHDAVLHAEDLVKTYGTGRTQVRAVDDVSLDVRRGEVVLIAGPSGSGKTTLLSMLGALLRPTSGRIVIDGTDVTALNESALPRVRGRSIGFIFQGFNLLEALTVEENILFPARLLPGGPAGAAGRADALIDRLRLGARRRSLPRTLSGGEQQRVAIARALINAPPLVLADEPTGNLDSGNGQEVMMILHDIARDENRSVVLVTHDPRVEDIADRVLWLEDGALRDRRTAPGDRVRDPVCRMLIDARTAQATAEHGGRPYAFCSQRCQERFRAEPERYAARAPDPGAGSHGTGVQP